MSIIKRKPANGNLSLKIPIGDTLMIGDSITIHFQEIHSRKNIFAVVNAPKDTKIRRKSFEEKRNKVQRETARETEES